MEPEEEEKGRPGGGGDADEEGGASENKKESSSEGDVGDVGEDGGERNNERGEQGEVAADKSSSEKGSPAKDVRKSDSEPVVPTSAEKKDVDEATASISRISQEGIGEDLFKKLLENEDFMSRISQKLKATAAPESGAATLPALPEVRSPPPAEGISHDLVLQKGRAVAKDLNLKKRKAEVAALRDHNKAPLSLEERRRTSYLSHKRKIEKSPPGGGVTTSKKRSSSTAGFVSKEEQKKPRAADWVEYFTGVIKRFLKSSVATPDELETAGNFGAIDDDLKKSLALFKGSSRGKRNNINLDFYETMFRSVEESDVVKHMKVFVACDSHFSAVVQGDESVLTSTWEQTRWNQINTKNDLFSLVKDM